MLSNKVVDIPVKKVKRAIMSSSSSSKLSHVHRNKDILDSITSTTLGKIEDSYAQLVSLADLLGIEFDANNNIVFSTDTNILPYYLVDTTPDDLVDSSGNYLYIG